MIRKYNVSYWILNVLKDANEKQLEKFNECQPLEIKINQAPDTTRRMQWLFMILLNNSEGIKKIVYSFFEYNNDVVEDSNLNTYFYILIRNN